jgi:hypothetical protein
MCFGEGIQTADLQKLSHCFCHMTITAPYEIRDRIHNTSFSAQLKNVTKKLVCLSLQSLFNLV